MIQDTVIGSEVFEKACSNLIFIIIKRQLIRDQNAFFNNSLANAASSRVMTFLFRAFSDSVDWAYTPEVNAQIQESKSPHLYDAYAREPYTDKALPKEFRLPLLMVKSYVMRNKLNKHYTDFVMKHPKFLKDARSNRKNTMPMCTVMQDDEYLTWGSSARMNISLKPKAEVTDEDRRFIEGLTKNLNERQGKRDAHTTRWACGEQGCQNAIAREEAQKSKAAGTERCLSESLAQRSLMPNIELSR